MKILKTSWIILSGLAVYACSNQSDCNILQMNLDEANLIWRGKYDNSTHRMQYIGDWAGCGWQYGDDSIGKSADFSQFDQLIVTVDSINTDTATLFLNIRYTNFEDLNSTSAPIINGKSTFRIDLDPEGKAHVVEFFIMSKRPCELTLTSVTFRKAIQYGKEHELNVNNTFIAAAEFDGYSDEAIVSFNYCAEGEMTHLSDSGTIERMDNWGIGIICSVADPDEITLPAQRIILKELGAQTFTCRLGDIRYMIEPKDETGKQGIYWNVWTDGNLTKVYPINATIKDAI